MLMLNNEEALNVFIAFLEQYYDRTCPNDTGIIAEALRNKNCRTHEQQDLLNSWENSLKEIAYSQLKKNGLENINEYTEKDVFEAIILMLEKYYEKTNSDDIGSFLGDLQHPSYGVTADPAAWHDWQRCLQQIKCTR